MKKLLDSIHIKVLLMRQMEYLINQEEFKNLYLKSNEKDKEMLKHLVENGLIDKLKDLIRKYVKQNEHLSSMTLEDLKIIAKNRGLPSTLPKDELLGVLLNDRRHSKIT